MIKTCHNLLATAPLVYPDSRPRWRGHRLKYWVRGLALARSSKEWFNLMQQPALAIVAQQHPYIYCKIQRPYLHRNLNARQRLAVLKQHYHFVATRFCRSKMADVYASPGLLLARIPLETVGHYGVRLSYGRQEKEGDLLLQLVCLDTDQVLFELSFCISRCEAPDSEIFIGGLQGNQAANDHDLIVALTRAMYGLRPKALLVFMLQQLVACWNIDRIRAVSDEHHIYQHPRKRRKITTSYDALWVDSGGLRACDGMFDLPATFSPRDLATLKANKRQLYRRRYVFLAAMAEQVQQLWPQSRFERL